jgi:hypothetical protein
VTRPKDSEPPKYLEARVRERLALDDRTNNLDVQVTIAGHKVFLIGQVESEERRRAATEVLRDVVPDEMEIVNELWVATYENPPELDERT